MRRKSIAVAIALIAVGCAASGQDKSPRATIAMQPALADGAANYGTLPVYPGATNVGLPPGVSVVKEEICGSQMIITDYRVGGVAPAVIAKWYAARMPGAVHIPLHPGGAFTGDELFAADGSAAVAVVRGGDEVTALGLTAYHPNLSSDVIHLLARYSGGSQAEKDSARGQLKAKCPDLVKS